MLISSCCLYLGIQAVSLDPPTPSSSPPLPVWLWLLRCQTRSVLEPCGRQICRPALVFQLQRRRLGGPQTRFLRSGTSALPPVPAGGGGPAPPPETPSARKSHVFLSSSDGFPGTCAEGGGPLPCDQCGELWFSRGAKLAVRFIPKSSGSSRTHNTPEAFPSCRLFLVPTV